MSKTKLRNALSGLRGRFFGLTTTQGETLNVQLLEETPFYIVARDNNSGLVRKFAKTSVKRISIGGEVVA